MRYTPCYLIFTVLLKKKKEKKEEKRLGMKCRSYFSIKLLPTCDILMATLFPHHVQASYLQYFSGFLPAIFQWQHCFHTTFNLPTCDISVATLFPHHIQSSYLRYFSGDVVSHYMQASYLRYFSGGASGFSSGSGLGMLSVSGLTDC